MNERGWGLNSSEVRRIHLAEWIARQQPDTYFSVEGFYDSLADQSANTWDAAHSDLKYLEERGLIKLSVAMGGIRGLHVGADQGVRDLAEELRDTRADKRQRKSACRDAMVDWLYSQDVTTAGQSLVRNAMLDDPRHGLWWGESFTARDLDDAAAWLKRNGLADGPMVEQEEGPVRLYLTDAGVTCVEDFGADTGAYMDAQRRGPKSGPSLHIGTNSAPFMVAGDHAQQTQNLGASVTDLQTLITSLAEVVRSEAPGAAEVAVQEQAALEAVTPGKMDTSALKRFGEWVVSTVKAGASAAMVPVVSAAVRHMLAEAARIAGHL
jgi:hypothetical protein